MPDSRRRRPLVAAIAAFSLVLDTAMPLAAAVASPQAAKPATAQPATAQPAVAKAATPAAAAIAPPIDGGWPRAYALSAGGNVLVYQPQIATWEKQAHLVAFSAVSYRATTADKPALGTIKLEAETKVALTERLVRFQRLRVVEANFSTLPKDRVAEIAAAVERRFPPTNRSSPWTASSPTWTRAGSR